MTDLDLDEAVLAGLAERIERGGLMDLSDWRSVILALMRDREGLRARNAEVAYLREQRDKALARVRELEAERDEARRERDNYAGVIKARVADTHPKWVEYLATSCALREVAVRAHKAMENMLTEPWPRKTGTDTIQPGTLRYPDDVDPRKMKP
jgi:hypothetical protein